MWGVCEGVCGRGQGGEGGQGGEVTFRKALRIPSSVLQMKTWPQSLPLTTYSWSAPMKLTPFTVCMLR